ncbi:MAG: phosphatase [Clostridia bacterium]|nr:phosphatase [Clostridia bacterium]
MEILTDLHTHTTATPHAYSTVTENAFAAKQKGMEAIAMTNHFGVGDAPHIWHFVNIGAIPKEIHGVRVLRGAEVNILDLDGTIDMPEDVMAKLDIVVASIHRPAHQGFDGLDHTKAYMNVVENPYIDIVGHSGSPEWKYDYETVVKRAGELGKMIEINANTFRIRKENIPNCKEIAMTCKKLGTHICVNSDAHYCDLVGRVDAVVELLKEIDFPEELIANRSFETLKKFMAPRKKF